MDRDLKLELEMEMQIGIVQQQHGFESQESGSTRACFGLNGAEEHTVMCVSGLKEHRNTWDGD